MLSSSLGGMNLLCIRLWLLRFLLAVKLLAPSCTRHNTGSTRRYEPPSFNQIVGSSEFRAFAGPCHAIEKFPQDFPVDY